MTQPANRPDLADETEDAFAAESATLWRENPALKELIAGLRSSRRAMTSAISKWWGKLSASVFRDRLGRVGADSRLFSCSLKEAAPPSTAIRSPVERTPIL